MSEIVLRFRHSPAVASNFTLDIDTRLSGRGVTGIYGPSASGKSTLLRCIAGLIKTANGKCIVNGEQWQTAEQFVPVHQRQLGYVFQQANLFEHLSVERNLTYGYKRLATSQQRITFDETIELLGLTGLLNRNPLALSGGQRQRVAIGRALLTSPTLLLMDEPLASLDSDSKQEILPYLERLHNALDIPVIYVSHSLDELLRIADHLLLINDGKLIAHGPLNELLTREDLPLASLNEASVVYEGQLAKSQNTFHLSQVSTAIGSFLLDASAVNAVSTSAHSPVRIRIAARDVSITLTPATDTSISHILPAMIESIQPGSTPAKMLVKLNVDGNQLLASITTRSVVQLELKPGKNVFAQVKSVALL